MAADRVQHERDGTREDVDALGEIRKRLISIHYELAEGPFGDRDLQRRTRERLADLLAYVNKAIGSRSDVAAGWEDPAPIEKKAAGIAPPNLSE